MLAQAGGRGIRGAFFAQTFRQSLFGVVRIGLAGLGIDHFTAIDAFEHSDTLYRFLPKELIRNLVQTKRQELHYLAELTPEERVELYLDTV